MTDSVTNHQLELLFATKNYKINVSKFADLYLDSARTVPLYDGARHGDQPGVRGPHTGHGEGRHVQPGVPGDEVLSPPAVGVLGQQSVRTEKTKFKLIRKVGRLNLTC